MTTTVERDVEYYAQEDGTEPVKEWINKLKRKNKKIEVSKINSRIKWAKLGNYGDHRFLAGSLFELKIDCGPGYRVYVGEDGDKLLLLLHGGTKDTQQKDIDEAKQRWDQRDSIELNDGGRK